MVSWQGVRHVRPSSMHTSYLVTSRTPPTAPEDEAKSFFGQPLPTSYMLQPYQTPLSALAFQ